MSLKEFVGATCTETVSGIIFDLRKPTVEDIDINDICWALSRINRYTGHTITKKPYTVAQHTVMVSYYCQWALTPGTEYHDMLMRFIDGKITDLVIGELEEADRNYEMKKWGELHDHVRDAKPEHAIRAAFHGLAHDFCEAYLTDVPSPVKRMPGMYEAIREAEAVLEPVVFEAIKMYSTPTKHPGDYELNRVIVHWADMLALKIEAYHMMPSRGLSWNLPQEKPSLMMLDAFRWPVDGPVARDELLERYHELRPADVTYG
jgi:hypothetical protein